MTEHDIEKAEIKGIGAHIEETIETTFVGNLLRLFRNATTHQDIIPVAEVIIGKE